MKLAFEDDPTLRTTGRFVFVLDAPPERPFVVRVDGRIVKPWAEGRYELADTPKAWPESLAIEVCSGPFYAPPVRWILMRAAMRALDAKLRAAHEKLLPKNPPPDTYDVNLRAMRDFGPTGEIIATLNEMLEEEKP